MKKYFLIILLSVLVVVVGSVFVFQKGRQVTTEFPTDSSKASSEGVKTVVAANNKFAIDAYLKFREKEGNVFFSPYSLSTALAMTYEGARGKTGEEIQKVFHFPSDNNLRRSSFARIQAQLNKANTTYKLKVANALWAQNDYKFLGEYIDALQKYYDGKATNVDFQKSREATRKTINSWVEEKTNNKIKDLFSEGSLGESTRLVLTNAIYFKGQWVRQFDKRQTINEDFRISSNNLVKVPMMRLTGEGAKFKYAKVGNLLILEMPYDGKELSMLVLLPKENELSSLERSLSLEKLNEWKNKLVEQRVDVFFPKFTFNTKYSMNETLAKMGMPTAFSNADFSGMDGTRSLALQLVIHQAIVDVNEEGTEAAAATGVSAGITSINSEAVPVFRADHPFIFLIQDNTNGNILFFGRVSNPN